jgi:hypothetical protein
MEGLDNYQSKQAQRGSAKRTVLVRYNQFRGGRGLEEISQRRLGDAMAALGYRAKIRLSGGRVDYRHLAWASDAVDLAADTAELRTPRKGSAITRPRCW